STPPSPLSPYTTLFRSLEARGTNGSAVRRARLLGARRLDVSRQLLGRQHEEERVRGCGGAEEVCDQVDPDVAPFQESGHHRADRSEEHTSELQSLRHLV